MEKKSSKLQEASMKVKVNQTKSKYSYPLYEEWYKLLCWLLDKCDKMPKHTRFTISGRIANLALQVQEDLILASFSAKPQQENTLQTVNIHLEQLRLYMRLCKDKQYFSIEQYRFASESINICGRMCGGWMKHASTKYEKKGAVI